MPVCLKISMFSERLMTPAAAGDDRPFFSRERLAGPYFGIAEAIFTDGKEFGNRLSFLGYDDVIGIEKVPSQTLCQSASESRLTAAGHTDDDDVLFIFHNNVPSPLQSVQ